MLDLKGIMHNFRVSLLALALLVPACASDDGGSDSDSECIPGEQGCTCNAGQCLGVLVCVEGLCMPESQDDTGDSSESGEESTATNSDTSSDGMTDDATSSDSNDCSPSELECSGSCIDPQVDNQNCGVCGNICIMVAGLGGCVEGKCSASWSECISSFESLLSCNDVCTDVGLECNAGACEGGTISWFGSPDLCEDYNSGGTTPTGCSGPTMMNIEQNQPYYRCCCEQP